MKRIFGLLLTLLLLLNSVSCAGNYGQIDLNQPVSIPENGIIEKALLEEIKQNNAVATFEGSSNEMDYRWIIWGKDLEQTRDVNLSLELTMTKKGIRVKFAETEQLGFPAFLSIYLSEKWIAEAATAYCGDEEVYSVSITGSKTSILNLSVNEVVECEIIPHPSKQPTITTTPAPETIPDKDQTQDSTESSKDDIPPATSKPDDSPSGDRPVSDGKETDQDEFQTDPVPEGKPLPVEPEDQEIDKRKKYTCTFSIECSTILNNLSSLDPDKLELVPSNGVILAPTKVTFYGGESVFDVLKRVCKENNIHLEFSWTPIYNSAYIEGIHNLYEFDCGELSGWMYRVDGWYPNYGCSRYQLADGEVVEWRYTCDLGRDVGEDRLGQS